MPLFAVIDSSPAPENDRRIGITSTVPVEVLLAAGLTPLDLNNAFIVHPEREKLLSLAERDGFPAGVCAWIKGIYGVILELELRAVVAVTNGDCSNTAALAEVLADRGVRVIRFGYPESRDRFDFERVLERFCNEIETTAQEAQQTFKELEPVRKTLGRIDALTWYAGQISGRENHRWLVAASDFEGEPEVFGRAAEVFVGQARTREPVTEGIRIGIAGVPAIYDDLYEALARRGVQVVYNEVQRQFSLPAADGNLINSYLAYTYPYDFAARLKDIRQEVRRRKLAGLIHYVQSFCHRGIQDILLHKHLEIPVLTLEGDRPGPVDGRTKVRLDAFLEMIAAER